MFTCTERANDSLPVESSSELPITTDIQEVTHPLSERSWLTSSNTAIRQGKEKSKSRREGGETELDSGPSELEEGSGGKEDYSSLTLDRIILPQYASEQSIPLPTSGHPIDPDSTTECTSDCFSPVATQLDFTHHGTTYHDTGNKLLQAVPQSSQQSLFHLPKDLLPLSSPHTLSESCDQQNDFSVNTLQKKVVRGK